MLDLLYYDLGAEVTAFSSRRHGGVGVGAYTSFNINAYCGDNPLHVQKNKELLCAELHIQPEQLVYPHQTHSTRVMQIDSTIRMLSARQRAAVLEGVDALYTNEKNLCIGVSTADCIPVFLYDPVHHVVAAIHAGWRGTVGKIVIETLTEMHHTFQSNPEEIRAVIGPGISLEAFEVGHEVYENFASAGFPMEQIAVQMPDSKCPDEMKWHIDLWEANRLQLLSRGVPEAQIYLSGICTVKHEADFFSARRHGINSGRIFNGIMLHEA